MRTCDGVGRSKACWPDMVGGRSGVQSFKLQLQLPLAVCRQLDSLLTLADWLCYAPVEAMCADGKVVVVKESLQRVVSAISISAPHTRQPADTREPSPLPSNRTTQLDTQTMAAKTSAPSAMASSSVSGASIVNAAHALPPAPSGSLGTGVAAGPNANSSSTSGGGGGSGSNAAGTSVSSGIAQLVTPHARDTSLAPNRQVDASAIDYLTTEMTYTLQESAQVAAKRLLRHREELREAGFPIQSSSSLPPGGADSSSANGAQRSVSQAPAILAANASRRFSSLSLHNGPSEEEVDVELTARLELIGYHVGANMSERCVSFSPCPSDRSPTRIRGTKN